MFPYRKEVYKFLTMNDNINFKRIEKELEQHHVVLFMNGTPMFPLDCLSAVADQFLDFHKVKYTFFNVAVEPSLNEDLSAYSGKITLPQLFIGKELVATGEEVREFFTSDRFQKYNKM